MSDFIAGPITDPLTQRLTAASTTLVDAANIALDASLGDVFVVTLGGNRVLSAPTNPKGGQRFTLVVKQDAVGGRSLTFNAAYTDTNGVVLYPMADAVTVLNFVTVVSPAGVFSHACVGSSTTSPLFGRVISGIATIANAASSATVAVGATFDNKPVNCTILCAPGVKQFSAIGVVAAEISGGNLVIHAFNPGTGAAVTADPALGVKVAYTIDGR